MQWAREAKVTTRNQEAHEALERLGWGHGPFTMKDLVTLERHL